MVQRSVSRESDQINLRLPDGLRARIRGRAAKNNRSMNAEAVSALEAAFPAPDENDLLAAAKEVVGRWYTLDWKEGELGPDLLRLCAAVAKAEGAL